MSSFVSYLISGISLGSVYAIIALGYTMVYGIAKMLNFAHGDVIMVGSYVVYVAVSGMGLNPILAILLSIIICTLMGVVIEGVAYRPLRNAASPAGCSDHSNRCQLPASERGTSDLGSRYQIIQ